MGKFCMQIRLCSTLLLALSFVHCIDQDPVAVEDWFKGLATMQQKLTKLHFYFHDVVSGNSPTAMTVAKPSGYTSLTGFGNMVMADDVLTAGPESNSTVVGRAQGMYASASMDDLGFLMTMNLAFTDGDVNGSTLSLFGRNPVLHEYREMSIVGGSGVFRMARGIATAKTYSSNLLGDAIVEYHIMVSHY
ncbi:dirigent protein 22-like [Cynara cardunculus var. scolymus]|uniref:Dirigent protein n=1 Tax=Cynara cardunculus var. scolymus TaxID=59895 RepID=A0A103XTK3_CYNCS|nr:dirigent protein 22-like [Cynara cardunculus var. scolymus]KVH96599.1 Plant disease resistance response protein [Cynara cardunculus var. scolymus]